MVFEPVEVFVTFAANFALVRLLLFHAQGAWVGGKGGRIDNGEGAVGVLVQLLVIMSVLVDEWISVRSLKIWRKCLQFCGTSVHSDFCMLFHNQSQDT